VLAALDQIPVEALCDSIGVGELGWDGSVRHIRGVLSIAPLARERGFLNLFAPSEDAAEAALIPDVDVMPVNSLADLVNHLCGIAPIAPPLQAATSSELT
jgi:magnesium chelatase family protein